jgi:sarcosine dehydrogenase
MINGPESFTPDGNFILGTAPECSNMFVGAGFNAFGIACRRRRRLGARPMDVIDGEAPLDLWVSISAGFQRCIATANGSMTARLKPMASTMKSASPTRNMKAGDHASSRRSTIASNRYRAVFGSKLGWERPNWFAPEGMEPRDIPSMGRQNWFDAVGEEHRHVREKVGIFDQSSFAKYEISGPDALKALRHLRQ